MDLTNQLTDAIFCLSRLMKQNMGAKSEFAHLSMVQIQTLFFLKKNGIAPMRQIAEYVQIELPSATSLVDTLEKLDLVKRNTDNQDKRVVNVALTKKAETFLENIKEKRKETIGKVLLPLSDEDKKQFLIILNKLTQGMDKENER